jgi:hypothetical protein
MALVKFARYTALTADKLVGTILSLTSKLEESGVLQSNRASRAIRDAKMRQYAADMAKSDQDVAEMMKLIPDHPDSENLVRSLFRDLRIPTIRSRQEGQAHGEEVEQVGGLPRT